MLVVHIRPRVCDVRIEDVTDLGTQAEKKAVLNRISDLSPDVGPAASLDDEQDPD